MNDPGHAQSITKPPSETQLDRIEALLRMLYRQQGEMKQTLAKMKRSEDK